MPDSFFAANKPRKRKRTDSASASGPSSSKKGFTKFDKTKGRPHTNSNGPPHSKYANGAPKKRKVVDEELESDHTDEDAGDIDDMDLREDMDSGNGLSEEEDDPDETPAEKRLRLAKLYLESVKEGLNLGLAEGEFDAAEIDKDLISARLKQDVMEHSGKVHLFVSDSFDFTQPPKSLLRTRGHRLSVTAATTSTSGRYLFTSGKEGSIIKWDLHSGVKISTFHKVRPAKADGNGKSKGKGKSRAFGDPDAEGHTDEVLALALSDDGRYLASGGRDRKVGVWDAEKGVWMKGFVGQMGHKDLISSLAFRKGSHQLYTGSFDRTLKVYDLSPSVMGYVETLFGHQDHVLALDALRGETCVSVGARDKTVRYWKIVEESQLVFRGGGRSRVREVLEGGLRGEDDDGDEDEDGDGEGKGKGRKKSGAKGKESDAKKFIEGSLECVAMIDENTFVSGGDSGSICLWNTQRKKAVFTQPLAHGLNEVNSETAGLIQTPRWVTALASLRYSDMIASGSWDGDIRIWKLDSKLKSFSLIGTISAPGVVNSLQLITPPKEFFEHAAWAAPVHDQSKDTSHDPSSVIAPVTKKLPVNPVLLIAGLGQEHRLGRWLKVKEGGAVNGSLVVALSPRVIASA